MIYGQTLVFNAAPTTSFGAIIDRFEDTTALVGDLNLGRHPGSCGERNRNREPEPADHQAGIKARWRYRIFPEILLNVGAGTTLYSGVISGSTVTFTGISIGVGRNSLRCRTYA